LKRNQLRQYVRIEASLPVKFRIIRSESNENKDFCDRMSQAKMSDISGGGLSFLFEKPLTPGDILSVNFQLPGASFVGIAAKVLRVSLQEGKTATFYKHHIQFSGIESRQRDQIVRFVFEKQRQLSQWR
jgi:c-di-GMP-binding flagellar brake protein YcgR